MSGIALPTGSDYSSWETDLSALWVNVDDGSGDAARQWDQGKLPYLHMMFHPGRQGKYPIIQDIADGKFDVNIRAWLERVLAYEAKGRRAVLVPWPEMNGNWVNYGVNMDDPNPSHFVDPFRYVVWLGKKLGIKSPWCWAPNNTGVGKLSDWWPGSDVVDVVGMSAYNWGGLIPGKPWTSALDTIMPYVDEVRRFSQAPVVITQTGCLGSDPRTPQWLSALVSLQASGKIDDFIWFSIKDGASDFAYPDRDDFNRRVTVGSAFCAD